MNDIPYTSELFVNMSIWELFWYILAVNYLFILPTLDCDSIDLLRLLLVAEAVLNLVFELFELRFIFYPT